ncbi:hypothetical protein HY945_05890 [Candidatus Gottesmanbacteria bacterium]|nr:hypothetical protein [Candidatus Gottesmanbacteria bacterium]
MKRRQKQAKSLSNIDTQIEQIELSLKKLKTEEDRLIRAYTASILTLGQLKEQNQSLQDKKEQLNTEKAKLLTFKSNKQLDHKGVKNVKIYLRNFKRALDRFDFEKKQRFLRLLLNEIIINERQLLIRGVLPIKANFNLCPQPAAERPTRRR